MASGSAEAVRRELRLSRARDRVHGAYLFEGSSDTRARELAIWFARLLLCRADEEDPCATCRDCRLAHASAAENTDRPAHPDLHWVEPEGAYVKVGQVRALQRDLSLVANEGGRRIGLIVGAEKLTDEASNALLKTLEEPPRGTTLLLVTDRAQALLPTLRSRITHMRVARTAENELLLALTSEGFDRDDAWLASALGGGSLSGARSWADQHLDRAREMHELLAGLASRGAGEILDFAESFRGGEAARQRAELLLDVTAAFAHREVAARSKGDDPRGVKRWLTCYESATQSRLELRKRNLNPQLVIEGLLLNLRASLT